MIERPHSTPYPDVNAVLDHFLARLRSVLGDGLVGMYVCGSLAVGDFDPRHSDIDFIAVTDGEVSSDQFAALEALHAQFIASGSPWAKRIEAAYLPRDALHHAGPTADRYPQIEKDRPLAREPLEPGWAFQRHALREYGLVVAGPDPRTLTDPVDPADMRRAALVITSGWLAQARHDPSWLEWIADPAARAFVVLTLCRILVTLESGEVVSKPAAARWGQQRLGPR